MSIRVVAATTVALSFLGAAAGYLVADYLSWRYLRREQVQP